MPTKNRPARPATRSSRSPSALPTMIGDVVVVRSGQSGVHVGRLLAKNGDGVLLSGSGDGFGSGD